MRLNVFRSNNHIYAQVIDDKEGNTVCAASTLDESIKSENPKGNDRSAAGRVGALLAERAKAKGLDKAPTLPGSLRPLPRPREGARRRRARGRHHGLGS